jgi:hypothetical protein
MYIFPCWCFSCEDEREREREIATKSRCGSWDLWKGNWLISFLVPCFQLLTMCCLDFECLLLDPGPWHQSTFKRTSRRVWKCFILNFFYLVQVYLSKLTDLATYWTYLQHQEAKNQNPPLCFSDKRVHLYICLKHMCMPLGRFIPYCSRL